jgi:hypothetical protein
MTATTPLRSAFSAMVLDTTLAPNKIVLLNTGNFPSYSSYLNETWLFNGTGTPNWTNTGTTLIDPNGVLPGRTDHVMAFDGTNVMLYGGRSSSSTGGIFQDTWLYGGTPAVWTKSTAVAPFGRYKAQATYLAGSGAVMFGGQNLNGYLNETWIWSTGAWTQVVFANGVGPGGKTGHVMAADGTQVIMFGGRSNKYQTNNTWKFNGTTWTELQPTVRPSIRSEACMAYDSVNAIYVMFGGQNEYYYLPETWTFKVATNTWTQVPIANGVGPEGRVGAQMAFDTVSGQTIMFGGISGKTNYPSNATWSFNGATSVWTQL